MTRLYISILSLFLILLTSAIFLAWSSLGAPNINDAQAGYDFYRHLVWRFGPWSALVLLVLANALAILTKGTWPLWTTLMYWCFGIFLYMWWLSDQYAEFLVRRLSEIYDPPIPLGPTMFVAFSVPALLLVTIDYFIVALFLRSRRERTAENRIP